MFKLPDIVNFLNMISAIKIPNLLANKMKNIYLFLITFFLKKIKALTRVQSAGKDYGMPTIAKGFEIQLKKKNQVYAHLDV